MSSAANPGTSSCGNSARDHRGDLLVQEVPHPGQGGALVVGELVGEAEEVARQWVCRHPVTIAPGVAARTSNAGSPNRPRAVGGGA
jgi:hypothetical protein